jgi:hypothetical protein
METGSPTKDTRRAGPRWTRVSFLQWLGTPLQIWLDREQNTINVRVEPSPQHLDRIIILQLPTLWVHTLRRVLLLLRLNRPPHHGRPLLPLCNLQPWHLRLWMKCLVSTTRRSRASAADPAPGHLSPRTLASSHTMRQRGSRRPKHTLVRRVPLQEKALLGLGQEEVPVRNPSNSNLCINRT